MKLRDRSCLPEDAEIPARFDCRRFRLAADAFLGRPEDDDERKTRSWQTWSLLVESSAEND